MEATDVYSGEVHPLGDLKVVDLTQAIAGPFTTMVLGDMGAEVIKIEAVGRGDFTRNGHPSPQIFDSVNRNKESIAVNLKTEEGQKLTHKLLEEADVFVENMKPGRLESFGLAYEDILETNHRIIHCSITGFGSGSPYENVPAFDFIIQAMSGIMSITGERDGPPVWSGLVSGDLAATMYATQSIIAALYAQERGKIDTEWIEVPMLDAAIAWLSLRAGYTFGVGKPFPRQGKHHPTSAPAGLFECDDGLIAVMAGTQSLWRDFCRAIDRGDLIDDDRFQSREARLNNREQLVSEIEQIFSDRSTDHWVGTLHEHEVPAGPVYDTKTVWEDEHVKRKGLHRTLEREGRERADVVDNPVHFSNLLTSLRDAPPELGQDTEEVMTRHGYDMDDIADYVEKNIVE